MVHLLGVRKTTGPAPAKGRVPKVGTLAVVVLLAVIYLVVMSFRFIFPETTRPNKPRGPTFPSH